MRVGERVTAYHGVDSGVLGGRRAQELATCRIVLEQPAHDDGRAARGPQALSRRYPAAGQLQVRAGVLVRRAADDADTRDGGDAGQRFAPEAERGDGLQFARGFELAGGEALKGEIDLVGRDAGTVVGDADALHAATAHLHGHLGRAGVERVLDELFDDGRRALDHLTGGDAGRHVGGEHADRHGSRSGAQAVPFTPGRNPTSSE